MAIDYDVKPALTKLVKEEQRGRDFLGQQPIIQHMTNIVIPSFTNTTHILKYYSFWAWAFSMLEKNSKKIAQDKWKYYLNKLENAFVIANRIVDPNISGLIGTTVIKQPSEGDEVLLYEEKVRVTSFRADYYSPSIVSLNLLGREGNDYSILPLGQDLANALNQELSVCEGYEKLIDPEVLTMNYRQLHSLSVPFSKDHFCDGEIKTLIKVFEQDEVSNSRRKQTTWMVLDIMKKFSIEDERTILNPLFTHIYEPPAALYETAVIWEIIMMRRYYQFSIESILHSFTEYLKRMPDRRGSFNDFSDRVVDYIS